MSAFARQNCPNRPMTRGFPDADQRKLYDLIWKRTIASQMAAARLERTTVDVGSDDGQVVLRATGQVMLFDGFLKVYEEGRDEAPEDGRQPPVAPSPRKAKAAKLAAGGLKGEFDKGSDDVCPRMLRPAG